MTATPVCDVRAFVDSVAIRFGFEPGAGRTDYGAVTVIDHVSPIEHPWPRRFWFRAEFINAGAPPEVLAEAVQAHLGDHAAEHVVLDFHLDSEGRRRPYAVLGYDRAWVAGLLGKDLDAEPTVAAMAPVVVRRAVSIDDARAIASLHGRGEGTLAVGRPGLHDFVLEENGVLAAHGQFVTAARGIAYVSEMLTAEGRRQRGHCRLLLRRIEAEARRLGCTRMILMPSLMAARLRLYERYGYRRAAPVAVLIPAAPTQ